MVNQQSTSLWNAIGAASKFEPLRDGAHVDVAIVGAGITGLTAAILLKNRGRRASIASAMCAVVSALSAAEPIFLDDCHAR